jgi:hypothetical protein
MTSAEQPHARFLALVAVLVALVAAPAAAQESSSASSTNAAPPTDFTAPIIVLEDTPIRVLTNSVITTNNAEQGTSLAFTVSDDVVVDNVLAIPRGALVCGEVLKSKKSGRLTGSPELILKLDALMLGGHTYPLYTYQFKVTGASKTRPTETKVLRGAGVGAIVGGSVVASKEGVTDAARVASATAGAAVGAGVGTLISAASAGPAVRIPAESEIEFQLASPIAVTPVSAKEAAHLAQGLHQGGPVLYVRGETP